MGLVGSVSVIKYPCRESLSAEASGRKRSPCVEKVEKFDKKKREKENIRPRGFGQVIW